MGDVITKGDMISLVPIPELAEMRGIAKGADTSNYRDRTDRLERSLNASSCPRWFSSSFTNLSRG
jgi:hypothetical protein